VKGLNAILRLPRPDRELAMLAMRIVIMTDAIIRAEVSLDPPEMK
jgi:hypothetical protein